MAARKADLVSRLIAALIDYFIAGVLGMLPQLGGLLALAYLLTRDAIWQAFMTAGDWRGRSAGKRLMGLRVVRTDGGPVDFATSAKRNVTLVAAAIILMVPVIGIIAAPLVALGLSLLELFLAVTDPQGQRFGDRLADTMVVRD